MHQSHGPVIALPRALRRGFARAGLIALVVAVSSGLAVALEACSRRSAAPIDATSKDAAAPVDAASTDGGSAASVPKELLGKAFLPPFDYRAVQELTIAKSDPATGDAWTTRLARAGEDPEDWTIALAPEGRHLGDHRADGAFILHLLDTLRTLQLAAPAPAGRDDTLGLAPPRFLLRFAVAPSEIAGAASVAQPRTYELRLGSAAPGESSVYGRVTEPDVNPAYGRTWIFRGAAVGMLGFMNGFETLRHRTLATLAADDVDEIEFSRGAGGAPFYAQREGDVWTDRRHRRLPRVAEFLERVAHARIRDFVDDAAEAKRLGARLGAAAEFRLVLKDRHGRSTRMEFSRAPDSLLASVSTRPGAVFRLFPEMARTFETFPPRR